MEICYVMMHDVFSDQRNLGMSMKIERSSLDQVKARFALNKKKLEEKKKDYNLEERVFRDQRRGGENSGISERETEEKSKERPR